jgi:hypothetical protein
MSLETIHVGVIGLVIELEVLDENGDPKDLSSASVLEIKLRAPGGSTTTYTAVLSGDGTDGKMRYVTASADDLDTVGQWTKQGYIEVGSFKGHTSRCTFQVYPTL